MTDNHPGSDNNDYDPSDAPEVQPEVPDTAPAPTEENE